MQLDFHKTLANKCGGEFLFLFIIGKLRCTKILKQSDKSNVIHGGVKS